MSEPVLVERRGYVTILTLNEPDSLNALTREMSGRLEALWPELGGDPSVRVIVMTGAGDRAFCSGAHASSLDKDAAGRERPYPRFTARQAHVYKPVITAVNGVCAAAGLHFVADADIVIASDRARFLDPHVNAGQVSALEPIGLSRKIPLDAVLRMVILGRGERVDAQAALRLGLVGEVVPHEKLMDRALELAQIAASVSPSAVQRSIRAIWEGLDRGLEDALEHGWNILKEQWHHPDSQEGARAFIEKREPRWKD